MDNPLKIKEFESRSKFEGNRTEKRIWGQAPMFSLRTETTLNISNKRTEVSNNGGSGGGSSST